MCFLCFTVMCHHLAEAVNQPLCQVSSGSLGRAAVLILGSVIQGIMALSCGASVWVTSLSSSSLGVEQCPRYAVAVGVDSCGIAQLQWMLK